MLANPSAEAEILDTDKKKRQEWRRENGEKFRPGMCVFDKILDFGQQYQVVLSKWKHSVSGITRRSARRFFLLPAFKVANIRF